MKNLVVFVLAGLGLAAVITAPSYAGVPFNNLEGVGGIAFNPLAYPAGQPWGEPNKHGKFSLEDVFTNKPQIGTWYVNFPQSKVGWATVGVAETFFNRLELSYGFENISVAHLQHIEKNNFGMKLLVLEETPYLPAVSVGTVYKNTTFDAPVDKSGFDFYVVASKLIKETLPKPVLISGGFLSTQGRTLGVLGFDDGRREVLFGNIDVILTKDLVFGFEYRQGAHYGDWKDSDYWDLHLGWLVNKNFSLAVAYVNTGNPKSTSKVGLGEGIVLSAQYQF